jgi:hypothetical protein
MYFQMKARLTGAVYTSMVMMMMMTLAMPSVMYREKGTSFCDSKVGGMLASSARIRAVPHSLVFACEVLLLCSLQCRL